MLSIGTGIALTRRYRAFISYSWADREWAEWLHRTLETYRTPRALIGAEGALGAIPERLTPIFKDREEEAAGHGITAAIEAALAESEFLIVLCSPNSAQSKWVNREIAWFKTNRDKRRILAIVVDGEPMASLKGDEAAECFPKALIYEVGDDLQPTERLEDPPLAADARKEGDGKRLAKLKLAAALMGSGLDALVRRDERRRAVRRRFVTGAAFALAAIFAGISVFAFNQRDAAIAARNEAVAAQAEAEFQKDEAQGLVEFMLTDLRKRLDAVGRLDILDAVAERLNESYAKQDLSKLDPDSLGRRARVQLLLGEVDNTRGNLDAALAQYKEAAASTEELLKRNPGKAQQIFDHAQSVFWVGYIAWQRGDAAEAKRYFTQYKDYADQLVAIDPDNEDWRMEVVYANSNLGTLAMDQGEAAEAEAYFLKTLEFSKRLATAKPDDVDLDLALALSYSWLALAQERRGAFAAAEASLSLEKAIVEPIVIREPRNSSAIERAQVNARGRARISLARGDPKTAIALLVELTRHQEALVEEDPENTERLQYHAWSLIDLGEAQIAAGLVDSATQSSEAANEIAATLAKIDSKVQDWQVSVTGTALRLAAKIKLAQGEYNSALSIIGSIRPVLVESTGEPIKDRDLSSLLGSIATLEARAYNKLGNIEAAEETAARAIAILEPNSLQLDPNNARYLCEAYLIAGSAKMATRLANQLKAMGYNHPEFIRMLEDDPEIRLSNSRPAELN